MPRNEITLGMMRARDARAREMLRVGTYNGSRAAQFLLGRFPMRGETRGMLPRHWRNWRAALDEAKEAKRG